MVSMGTVKSHAGYGAFEFLSAGEDFQEFTLVPQLGRTAGWDAELTDSQATRVDRLLDESVVISLHDHPFVFPVQVEEYPAFVRQGRMHTGYEGLAQSRMDAVFDNFLDGLCFITSSAGWKWTDAI